MMRNPSVLILFSTIVLVTLSSVLFSQTEDDPMNLPVYLRDGPVASQITLSVPNTVVQGDPNAVALVNVTASDGSSLAGRNVGLFCFPPGATDYSNTQSLNAVLDSDGNASFPLYSLPVGQMYLTPMFGGDDTYSSTCGNDYLITVLNPVIPTQTVLDAPSTMRAGDTTQQATITVTAADKSSLTGLAVNLAIAVQDPKTGEFTPVPSSPVGLTLDFNGQAIYGLGTFSPGTYQLDANFPAQGNYQASDSGPQTLVVYPPLVSSVVPTHIKLTVPNPIYLDNTTETGSVQVTADDGSVPKGTVDIYCTGFGILVGPVASFHYPEQSQFAFFPSNFGGLADLWFQGNPDSGTLQAEFQATFSPDDDTKYYPSASDPVDSIVANQPPPPAPAVPTVTVSPIPATMNSGEDPTATVTASDAKGNPLSGKVWLHIDGFAGSPFEHTLDMNGQTVYHFASLVMQPPGITYSVWAEYPAQNGFGEIDSTKQQIKVVTTGSGGGGSPVATSTSITAPPITDGSIATVTITVKSATGGTPTGTVNLFISGDGPFPLPLNEGVASINLHPTGGPGDYKLDATYVPMGNFQSSTAHADLIVNQFGGPTGGSGGGGNGPIATTTTITAPSIADGSQAVVTVAVKSANGVPTGTVQLSVSGDLIGLAYLDANGVATYHLQPSGGPGDYTLDATYVPSGNFQASSAHGDLIVKPVGGGGQVTYSVSISYPSQISVGDEAARATVSVTASDGSVPAGQVTLSYTGPWPYSGAPFKHDLVNGQTKYTLYSLPVGSYQLKADYVDAGNNSLATASAGPLKVD